MRLYVALLSPRNAIEDSQRGATTFSIMTLSITSFGIMTLSIMSFGIMTLSITTFIVTILRIKGLCVTMSIMTLSIKGTQHNNTLSTVPL
jgi:hypothetical protein